MTNNTMSTTDLQNHNQMYDRSNNYQHPITSNITAPTMSNSSTTVSMKTEDEDMDFQDNKSETSSRGGNSKSKVFQCTGYGECSMVFTRSEHLARHMRKHTGEKPFKCVVPGCERMFSRFDNMMQHTQTHNKTRGGPRRTKTKTKRGGKKSTGSLRRANSSDDYDEYGPLPSPPPSRRGSSMNLLAKEQQIILPNPKYVEVDEDDDDMLISDDDQSRPPTQRQIINYNNYKAKNNFHENSIKTYPDSPASSDSSYEYFSTHQHISRRRSAPKVHYQPYPYNYSEKQPEVLPVLPRRNSALSQLATYLVNNPNESPESYLTKNRPLSSSASMPKLTMTRRLSIQDLSNPIESLNASNTTSNDNSEGGVDLTEDEYEAIQGFGQFYRSAITCNK